MHIYFNDEAFDYVDDEFNVYTSGEDLDLELSKAFQLMSEYHKLTVDGEPVQRYELSEDKQTLAFYTRDEYKGKHWTRLPGDMTLKELDNYCDIHDLSIAYDGTLQPRATYRDSVWVSDTCSLSAQHLIDMLDFLTLRNDNHGRPCYEAVCRAAKRLGEHTLQQP